MATFTYTAKREIARVDLAIEADDISASAANSQFSSVDTDLSGLEAGDWILVSGFDSQANNGWHEVAETSAEGAIKVESTLETESAGDVVRIVGYAHGLGAQYAIEIGLASYDRQRDIEKHVHRSDAGDTETWHVRTDRVITVQTDFVDEDLRPFMEEFLASVEAGEAFIFDPAGTAETPSDPVEVELVDDAIRPARVGTVNLYTYSFTMRVR